MSGAEKISIKQVYITDNISYIPASDNPLSADIILAEGEEYLYVFDVGNNGQVAEYLNTIPKRKRVILSHFHTDHMGNIGRVKWENVYLGANTEKYFRHYITEDATRKKQDYVMVSEPVIIEDGITIEICPVPNSHAKGSLLLQVDGEYIFIGDSLYSKVENGKYVYNAQLLKEEIELLKKLPGKQVFSSHEERPLKAKAGVIRFLEQIYAKRTKDSAYIYVSR